MGTIWLYDWATGLLGKMCFTNIDLLLGIQPDLACKNVKLSNRTDLTILHFCIYIFAFYIFTFLQRHCLKILGIS